MATTLLSSCLGFLPTTDPQWHIREDNFDPAREPAIESKLAISNGYLGTRAALEEGSAASHPLTLIAGIFERESHPGGVDELVAAPHWSVTRITVGGSPLDLDTCELLEQVRILDLRKGVLLREWRLLDRFERITRLISLRFASLHDRHALAQRLLILPENYGGEMTVELMVDGRTANASGDAHLMGMIAQPVPDEGVLLVTQTPGKGVGIAMAGSSTFDGNGATAQRAVTVGPKEVAEQWRWIARCGGVYRLDKLVSVFTSRDTPEPATAAVAHLNGLREQGLQALLDRHVAAWEQRWQDADVDIEGDEVAQRAIRFAAHHLIAAANPEDEHVSVGARALTGEGYRGHVFWDTEIFMLPFYTLTDPKAARSLLMYRYHSLAAARARARTHGYEGAMFAWESADSGEDVTPSVVIGPGGLRIPVLCGTMEHHIVADVAYAVWQYWLATGDREFMYGPGAELLLECARFWASRAHGEEDGRYHIRGVIGPDEYHEDVDDNAFTNCMAAWTLQRGVEVATMLRQEGSAAGSALLTRLTIDDAILQRWSEIAGALVTGFDSATGLFEQFEGYFRLEPLNVSGREMLPTAIDALVGRERVQQSQLIKQADVVMLLALLRDRFPADLIERNFRFYESRSNHGSSLSPAIHALVAARLGDMNCAYDYFLRAAEIDLGHAASSGQGVHAATLGGLWQALVFGFAGFDITSSGVRLDPTLPPAWTALHFTVTRHGQRMKVKVNDVGNSVEVAVEGSQAVPLTLERDPPQVLEPGRTYRAIRSAGEWTAFTEVTVPVPAER